MTMDQHPLPDGTANRRVWIAQLLAASSYMAANDSAGTSSTWTRSLTGPGQVHGVDNQSIAAGPYPNNAKPPTARAGADVPARAVLLLARGGECVLLAQRRRRG